jgi:sortase A
VRRAAGDYGEDASAKELLASLLAASSENDYTTFAPVALRSVGEHRKYALRNYAQRTWLDSLLYYAERLLAVAALAAFVLWASDGPLRDRLHEASLPSTPAVSSSAPGGAPLTAPPVLVDAQELARIPLPYIAAGELPLSPRTDPTSRRGQAAVGQKLPPEPTRLTAPAIGLDTPVRKVFVVDGAWEVAEYAAGYMSGTALPGQGNTALAGHAGIRGAVFRRLGDLAPSDDIYLEAGGRRYHYRVRVASAVWPNQTEVLDATPQPVLTLITCVNWDTQRLVVTADLVDIQPLDGT